MQTLKRTPPRRRSRDLLCVDPLWSRVAAMACCFRGENIRNVDRYLLKHVIITSPRARLSAPRAPPPTAHYPNKKPTRPATTRQRSIRQHTPRRSAAAGRGSSNLGTATASGRARPRSTATGRGRRLETGAARHVELVDRSAGATFLYKSTPSRPVVYKTRNARGVPAARGCRRGCSRRRRLRQIPETRRSEPSLVNKKRSAALHNPHEHY